jgi:hypothetical protein
MQDLLTGSATFCTSALDLSGMVASSSASVSGLTFNTLIKHRPGNWTEKRKEKTTPFGVNLMRSQVLYRAAQ